MKIFIIGMHRSGTSMITGILHKCGLELGKNLFMHGKDNPRGHFESRRFIQINQEILIRNGGRWHSPPKNIQFYPGMKNKMRQFINGFDPQRISGFKDPRVCLTFPLWYQAIHPEPIKAIMVVRPFLSIAQSLRERNDFSLEKGGRLTDHYVRSAFAAVNKYNVPHITAIYERFFRYWRVELEPILKFIGLKLPVDTRDIENFIDKSLWHHGK